MRVALGTSLLEFQVYLALTAVAALFLAQLLLLSHYTYDRIIFLADRQLTRAAAYSVITRACDQLPGTLGVQLKAGRLSAQIGQRQTVLLEGVKKFSYDLDKDKEGTVRGVWLTCDSDRWYRAQRKKALSCSWLLS